MASSTSLKSLDVDSDEEDGFLPERGLRGLGSPKPPSLCAFLRDEMRSLVCANDGSSSSFLRFLLLLTAALLVIGRMVSPARRTPLARGSPRGSPPLQKPSLGSGRLCGPERRGPVAWRLRRGSGACPQSNPTAPTAMPPPLATQAYRDLTRDWEPCSEEEHRDNMAKHFYCVNISQVHNVLAVAKKPFKPK